MDVSLNAMNVSFNSMASDIVAGVTRGKTVMLKHFLLALGIHSYTGQRKPVGILNCLGHCIATLPMNCLSVFDHFLGLTLKRLRSLLHT